MIIKAVFSDIDGTLVDSNEFHVDAWERAFQESLLPVDRAAIRRQIGKGADMLLPTRQADAAAGLGCASPNSPSQSRLATTGRHLAGGRIPCIGCGRDGHGRRIRSHWWRQRQGYLIMLIDPGHGCRTATTRPPLQSSTPKPTR
jgi:hypothetical protein